MTLTPWRRGQGITALVLETPGLVLQTSMWIIMMTEKVQYRLLYMLPTFASLLGYKR